MSWEQWIRTVEVEPSLYAADFGRLAEQIDTLLGAGVRVFHFDVGDGHFVEPITMGPIVLQSISEQIHREGGAIDVHLMVDRPAHYFGAFQAAGADSVTFHYEVAGANSPALAEQARACGLEVGLAFKPQTRVEDVLPYAPGFDLLLCMSIHPGYSGQKFIPESLERIRYLAGQRPAGVHVQVDGGISNDNVRSVYDAGANLIVAGSAIFSTDDLPRAYSRLLSLLT